MLSLFSWTLLVNSFLLFAVQPLTARLLLPRFGGTASVWNTCMVFFQTGLLAGYAYAHWAPSWLGIRRQVWLHLGLLVLPLFLLPLHFPGDSDSTNFPALELLTLLIMYLGLPYLLVASGGPLLQRWFAFSGHGRAHDPYFLYAASNCGSLAGLLAYPFFVEPTLTLQQQRQCWLWGYGLLILLSAGCALAGFRSTALSHRQPALNPAPATRRPPPATILRWLLLALVPSSLMLSVAQYLTTDLAGIPLLWILPLGLYLLTFVLAFAGRYPQRLVRRWLPLVVIILALVWLSEGTEPLALLVLLHLVCLFWVCWMCHGELARTRPAANQLTGFYLVLSLGGWLGGLFNALLAPVLFSSLLEYPLMLLLACFLWPGVEGTEERKKGQRSDTADRREWTAGRQAMVPLFSFCVVGLLTVSLMALRWLLALEAGPTSVAAIFAAPAVLCFILAPRPLCFAMGMTALLLASHFYAGVYGPTEYRLRSFYGVHRVVLDPTGRYRLLVHGTTEHGKQSLEPDRQDEPLHYYTRQGPIGQVMAALGGDPRLQRVAVVGLGTGALACYSAPGQKWTFFEIDPAVVTIARDLGLFTFLHNKPQIEIHPGDARLSLQQHKERFGVIVIDAFSSDAIPIHLLTQQALELYLERLAPDGLLLFHISNRYLDLQPVLADLARRVEPQLQARSCDDLVVSRPDRLKGKAASQWVLLARPRVDLTRITASGPWRHLQPPLGFRTWTDDYANLLAVFRW